MPSLAKPAVLFTAVAPSSTTASTRSDIILSFPSIGAHTDTQVIVGDKSNGFGLRTVSPVTPQNSQGLDGDIWYQV